MTAFVRRALYAWAGRLPAVIYDAEVSGTNPARTPLFERYHVFTCRLPWLGEVTLYLHHYLRSDPDRGPHDHPWPWAVALPLAGAITSTGPAACVNIGLPSSAGAGGR